MEDAHTALGKGFGLIQDLLKHLIQRVVRSELGKCQFEREDLLPVVAAGDVFQDAVVYRLYPLFVGGPDGLLEVEGDVLVVAETRYTHDSWLVDLLSEQSDVYHVAYARPRGNLAEYLSEG